MDTKAQEQKPIETVQWENAIFEAIKKFGYSPYIVSDEYKRFARLAAEEYATIKTESIQSENHRLTSERDSAYGEIKELVELLEDAINRMTKARKLLTELAKDENCWQMLNSEKYKSALEKHKSVTH